MQELQKLNKVPGVATNAMCLFLAINTAGFDLLPSGVVSARAGAGSADPWGIAGSTLFATGAATVAGVVVCKLAERFNLWPAGPPQGESVTEDKPDSEVVSKLLAAEAAGDTWGVWVVRGVMLLVMGAMGVPPLMAMALGPESDAGKHYISLSSTVGSWVIPSMFVLLVAYGVARGIEVYPTFVKGAKEGFSTGVMIIPYLVAILVAVALFRASGAMDYVTALGAVTGPLGLPGEVLPMAVVRPLSGSGAYAMLIDLLQKHGPDSFIGYVASTLQGSTDTTFYVIAVYFGSVGVTRGRHAIAAGLAADIAGVVATAVICRYLFASLMP
jgi:spore maturation protein SpmB